MIENVSETESFRAAFVEMLQTRNGKQLSQSNILRRHLHPALKETGFGKDGNHALRRYRNTFLRNRTHCPASIINFWFGWGEEGMSGHYDKIKTDVAFRKEW